MKNIPTPITRPLTSSDAFLTFSYIKFNSNSYATLSSVNDTRSYAYESGIYEIMRRHWVLGFVCDETNKGRWRIAFFLATATLLVVNYCTVMWSLLALVS